jgi:hypothetical protein
MDTDYVIASPSLDIPWGQYPRILPEKCILMMLCQSGRLEARVFRNCYGGKGI